MRTFCPGNDVGAGRVEFQVIPSIYQRNWFWPLSAASLSLFVWLAHRLLDRAAAIGILLVVAERIALPVNSTIRLSRFFGNYDADASAVG
jgi:hypothetical protein